MSARTAVSRLSCVAVPCVITGLLGWASPPERSRVAGSFTGVFVQQQAIEVGDAPGHMLVLAQAKGANQSTGPTSYMAGAEIVNAELADLTQGNGTHQGYLTMTKDGESTATRWSGKVTTVMGSDSTPITTVAGIWSKVSGTGRFDGVTGSGTYKGRMTSQKEYVIDWKGEISTNLAAK